MSKDRQIATLTPCAGRCSTVFGDAVCRGCRRFNHEVIQWNSYTSEQHTAVWRRLDAQLDQILVPMLPFADLRHVEGFIRSKRVRLRDDASKGRKLYHALKICEKIDILPMKAAWAFTTKKCDLCGRSLNVACWRLQPQVMILHF